MGGTTSCLRGGGAVGARLMDAASTGDVDTFRAVILEEPSLLTTAFRHPNLAAPLQTVCHVAVEAHQASILKAMEALLQEFPAIIPAALAPGCKPLGITPPSALSQALILTHNLHNGKGVTSLMTACCQGDQAMVQLLLSQGADPWARDRGARRTSLHYAVMMNHANCVRTLLSCMSSADLMRQDDGRYIDVPSACGFVPLHYAVAAGHEQMVQLLLSYDANINCASTTESWDTWCNCNMRSTPLHLAAGRGNMVIAALLLRYYAARAHTTYPDPRLFADVVGKLPHQVATARGHKDLATLLQPSFELQSLFPLTDLQQLGMPMLSLIAGSVMQTKLSALEGTQQQASQQRQGRMSKEESLKRTASDSTSHKSSSTLPSHPSAAHASAQLHKQAEGPHGPEAQQPDRTSDQHASAHHSSAGSAMQHPSHPSTSLPGLPYVAETCHEYLEPTVHLHPVSLSGPLLSLPQTVSSEDLCSAVGLTCSTGRGKFTKSKFVKRSKSAVSAGKGRLPYDPAKVVKSAATPGQTGRAATQDVNIAGGRVQQWLQELPRP